MTTRSGRMRNWLSLLLFMLICATLAYWATQWLTPPQQAVAPARSTGTPATNRAGSDSLFGSAAAPNVGDIRLQGVVAERDGSDRRGVAIVRIDNQPPRAFRNGDEVRNGLRISEVYPTYVILSGAGIRQRIDLPRPGEKAGK